MGDYTQTTLCSSPSSIRSTCSSLLSPCLVPEDVVTMVEAHIDQVTSYLGEEDHCSRDQGGEEEEGETVHMGNQQQLDTRTESEDELESEPETVTESEVVLESESETVLVSLSMSESETEESVLELSLSLTSGVSVIRCTVLVMLLSTYCNTVLQ